jgi:hypothetical protein
MRPTTVNLLDEVLDLLDQVCDRYASPRLPTELVDALEEAIERYLRAMSNEAKP